MIYNVEKGSDDVLPIKIRHKNTFTCISQLENAYDQWNHDVSVYGFFVRLEQVNFQRQILLHLVFLVRWIYDVIKAK